MTTKKNIILVIDDEESMRDSCMQILKKDGYIADAAENGSIGLEKIRALKPDVVLIDLKMPGISGMEVLDKIPEINPNIIPVVITGYATVDSAVEAMKRGAFDFLPKPFTPDELRIIVKRGLERKNLLEETARLREEKKKIEENFITMVSHQLRSPVATVQQYFEVILGGFVGEVPPKQKEMLEKARQKLTGLLELINDWLNMARISGDQLVERFSPTDLTPIIQNLTSFMEETAKKNNIILNFHKPDFPTIVIGDKETLEQVFSNIITNAIIYNRPGGTVDIKFHLENDCVATDIIDTGYGIPEKDLPFIFDQFYRVKREETKHIKGTGLGLPIAKKIIEAHNGSIRVNSIVNQGTTFTILIPKSK
jgi:signal transduction histidine kinase